MANSPIHEESTKSATIRSSSDLGVCSKGDLVLKKFVSYFDDALIPILAETNRLCPNINCLRLFTMIVTYMQLFFGGYFLVLPATKAPNWLRLVAKVVFIFSFEESEGPLQYLFIILDLITFAFMFSVSVDFHFNHKFRKWILNIIRVWHCHIFNILLLPNIVMTMNSFTVYGSNPSVHNAILCILHLLLIFFTFFHVFYILIVLEQNPFLTHMMIHFWRPRKIYIFIICNGFVFGLSTMTGFFPNIWARFIPQVLLVILSLYYLIFLSKDLPYESIYMNCLHHCFPAFSITSSFLSIIFDAMNYSNILLYYLLPLVVAIIIFVINIFIIRSYTIKIIRNLSRKNPNNNNEPYSPVEKVEHFNSLNLSISEAYYYLQVGLQYHSALFLDWSLSQFIVSKFPGNSELLIFVTWISAFFPSETHIFHTFITLGLKMVEPSYFVRAFFFQLHRIHIFRQSSASNESTRDFLAIQQKTKMCINLIKYFWETIANNPSRAIPNVIHHIYKQIAGTDTIWADMLDKYPNNTLFVHEYSRYLLDAKSQFQNAIHWHQKSLILEAGSKLHNDKMFRSFLKKYPNYLKSQVVDSRGNIVRKKVVNNKSGNLSNSAVNESGNTASTDDDDSEMIDMEEASTFLSSLKLRLAYEKAVEQMKSPILRRMNTASVLRLIAGTVFIVVVYFVLKSIFEPVILLSSHLMYFNKMSHPVQLLTHEVAWFYFSSFPLLSNTSKMMDIYERILGESAKSQKYYFDMDIPLGNIVYNLSRKCLDRLDKFTAQLYSNDASADFLIQSFSDIYSRELIDNIVCQEISGKVEQIINPKSISFDMFLRSYIILALKLVNDPISKRQTWGKKDNYCETFAQTPILKQSFHDLIGFASLVIESQFDELSREKEAAQIQGTANFVICFTPFVVLVLVLPNIIFVTSGLEEEKVQFTQMLLSINQEDALNASKCLFKENVTKEMNEKGNKITSFDFRQSIGNLFVLVDVALYTILCILLMTNSGITLFTNTYVNNLDEHFMLFFLQRNFIIDMCRDAQYLIFLNQMETEGLTTRTVVDDDLPEDEWQYEYKTVNGMKFIKANQILEMLDKDIENFNNITVLLENGYDFIISLLGFNDKIDEYKQKAKCTTQFSSSPIEFTKCISFDRLIKYISSQIELIRNIYPTLHITDKDCIELANLVESRIAIDYQELMELYSTIINQGLIFFNRFSLILFIVELIIAFIIYLIELILKFSLAKEFDVFKSILLRINPIVISSNPTMISFVYGSLNQDAKISTPAHAIFQTSHDSMILLSLDNVIESLNPAATTIFGFTPEQMLGQNISVLIPTEKNNQFYYVMGLMSSGQSTLTYESFVYGVKDNGHEVPLKMALIGFSTSSEKRADSFALLLKDMTEEEEQKAAVENAKKQAELILLQLLPKDIIMRLNRGDKNISFTVPSASIIFIDIEKFSIYASSLSADDIMKNLSKIFTTFDKVASNFSMITKIKLIGDIYMAAGGLFTPEADPQSHASQILQFALQALEAVEELNLILNANLQVRIGINTDGPLIAGVLGVEKPLFDIIGDPINVAARLQTTDIAGLVQISEGTYKYVAGLSFHIEQRGEIELKGKGKRMTYLVHPNEGGNDAGKGFLVDDDEVSNSSGQLSRMALSSGSLIISKLSLISKVSVGSKLSFGSKSSLHNIPNTPDL